MKTEADMVVFIIFEMKSNKTYEYQITFEKTELLIHEGILSRGKNIMPRIETKIMQQ